MNKKVKVLLAVILLPLSVVVPVLSLDSHYSAQTSAQATDTALADRVQQYKNDFKEEFTKAEQEKLKLRCSVVQANVKNLASRLGDIQATRTTAYDNIISNLNDLLAQLDEQAYEVASLQANVSELAAKVETFKTTMTSYKQAVDDTTIIDCTQDPTSFKAALESARNDQEILVTLVGQIREYVTNTVKPTLQNIRVQIEDGETTGGNQ